MDYGASARARNKAPRYSFWDYSSDEGSHPLSLLTEGIHSIEALDEKFDPAEFVTWRPDWVYPRDWGALS